MKSNFFSTLNLGLNLPKKFRATATSPGPRSREQYLLHSFKDVTATIETQILDVPNMAEEDLSHAEVWDDSALVKSWNEAFEEYKVGLFYLISFMKT